MSNSFEATSENLPQKFLHQIMKSSFENISYTRNGLIIIKQSGINIIINCVKSNEVLEIERLNDTSCNTPTYYVIVNLAECFINIHELENVDPIIQTDFINMLQSIQGFVIAILNFTYHPNKFIIQKLDFSNA